MRRNIEFKVADRDPEATLALVRSLAAVEQGLFIQRDTYFNVPQGRLKLREQEGLPAVLIPYSRDDQAKERLSNYQLVPVADPALLLQALEMTLGLRAVVEKRRHLFIWEETVRIHLDQVSGLGYFVEVEAVVPDGSDLQRERDQVEQLRSALALDEEPIISGGYADLLLASRSR